MQRAMKGNKRITDDTGLEQVSLQPDHAVVVNQGCCRQSSGTTFCTQNCTALSRHARQVLIKEVLSCSIVFCKTLNPGIQEEILEINGARVAML